MSDTLTHHTVAVVGAGPAGLYAARKLAQAGVRVLLINRDLKPGGLAEYGIYYTKHKMKEGLRKQFRKILAMPEIHYSGGVEVGDAYAVTLDELRDLGCSAVLFTIGAQGTKMLGLPGEENAVGVFHAKDLVYHFNQLPPFASQDFAIGQRVGIIGMGNVMVDVAHWLVCDKKVEEVVVVARRGPAERAYTDKEMREIVENLDQQALQEELARVKPALDEVGQDTEAIFNDMLKPLAKSHATHSNTRFGFRFLVSSKQILTDENGRVTGLEVEHNKLVPRGESLRPQGTGETSVIPMDTLIYAIGDQVDAAVGLPFEWGKFIVPSEPHPTVEDRARYEVYDPQQEKTLDGQFVGGWARIASDGLVGKARADGETAAEEVMHYLQTQETKIKTTETIMQQWQSLLANKGITEFNNDHVQRLEDAEKSEAEKQGKEFFKFNSDQEMWSALDS